MTNLQKRPQSATSPACATRIVGFPILVLTSCEYFSLEESSLVTPQERKRDEETYRFGAEEMKQKVEQKKEQMSASEKGEREVPDTISALIIFRNQSCAPLCASPRF